MSESSGEPVAYVPLDGDKPIWCEAHPPSKSRDHNGMLALYATPPSSGNADAVRERIARTINPEIFELYDAEKLRGTKAENGKDWADVVFRSRLDGLLQTADAILALPALSAPVAGEWKDITMSDVRLVAGEGKLSPHDVLAAVNGHVRLRLGSPVAFFMREET